MFPSNNRVKSLKNSETLWNLCSFFFFLVWIPLFFFSSAISASSKTEKEPILYFWIFLGEGKTETLRIVTSETSCPILTIDGLKVPSSLRVDASTIPHRSRNPTIPPSSSFPLLICEREIPPETFLLQLGEKRIPLLRKEPSRVLIVGNSGCVSSNRLGKFLPCKKENIRPFQEILKKAESARPDFVIHVGNLHYETLSKKNGNWVYDFQRLENDFFRPAKELLQTVPWVFVRGERELCQYAGQEWFRFFDREPFSLKRSCDNPIDDLQANHSEPYAISLSQDLQLLVFDNANSLTKNKKQEKAKAEIYKRQLQFANSLAIRSPNNLFLAHYPPLSAAYENSVSAESGTSFQPIVEEVFPKSIFSHSVQLLVSGNTNLFQILTFKSDHPAQLVVGNSGALFSSADEPTLPFKVRVTEYAEIDHHTSIRDFGFTLLERNQNKWSIHFWNKLGEPKLSCLLTDSKGSCVSPKTPHSSKQDP